MRRHSHHVASIAAVSLIGFVTLAPAMAAPPDTAPSQSLEAADELYRKANVLYDEGKHQEAYQAYLAAWERKKSFDIAGNLGDVELMLGKPRDAAEHLAYSLRIFPPNGRPEARDKSLKRLEEAKKQVGALNLTVNVARAQVRVDGRPVAVSPVDRELYVDAGTRTITAELEGHETATQTVTIAKGATQDVRLDLVPRRDTTTTGDRSARIPWIVAGGALAAVALGTGIGLTVASGSKADEADELLTSVRSTGRLCPDPAIAAQCTELEGLRDDHDGLANAGYVAFGIAGVAAAAAVTIFLWPEATPTQRETGGGPAAALVTHVAPGFGGFKLTGRF